MTQTIAFSSFSSNLGTRVLGQEIRAQIESILNSKDFVVFDFEGVEFVSHSFSDECFGKLLLKRSFEELKSESTFINASELVKRTIALAINDRLKASLAYGQIKLHVFKGFDSIKSRDAFRFSFEDEEKYKEYLLQF